MTQAYNPTIHANGTALTIGLLRAVGYSDEDIAESLTNQYSFTQSQWNELGLSVPYSAQANQPTTPTNQNPFGTTPNTGNQTGWTEYHESLRQQALALATSPEFNTPAVQQQLADINAQLLAASQTLNRVPVLDSQGNVVLGTDGQPVYQTTQQSLSNLFSQTEQARIQAQQQNEQRYDTLLSGYTGILNSTRDQYMNPAQQQYDAAASGLNASLLAASQGYADRAAAGMDLLNGLGNRARTDLGQRYTAARGAADNDLTTRGLGNTTVRNSVMSGIGSQENQDFQRLEEGLRREQLGYSTQLSGDYLQSLLASAAQNYQAQSQAAGARTAFGQQYAQLAAGPLGVMERRTDVAPNISDMVNLAMQFGRGSATQFALPGFTTQSSFQQPSSN